MLATYLLDTSAYWRIRRDADLQKAWSRELSEGVIALSEATRLEILHSARNGAERLEMAELLDTLFAPVSFHSALWPWVDAAQQRMADRSQRCAGVIDLMTAALAVERGLIVLHDDKDFSTAARVIPELRQYRITAGLDES